MDESNESRLSSISSESSVYNSEGSEVFHYIMTDLHVNHIFRRVIAKKNHRVLVVFS